MSTDLQWLIVRKWNSFLVKGGNGKAFSAEKVCLEAEGLGW
jgi:hypothetical protein